jgi:trimeric autotransporter adhesin
MCILRSRWSQACYSWLVLLGFGVTILIGGCGGGTGSSGGGGGSTPSIASISPTSVTAGSSDLTLTVNGSGFVSSSVVQVGGTSESTSYVSGAQLKATVHAAQIANGGALAVVVANGTLTSSSTPINLTVNNPQPTITSLSPSSAFVGTASLAVSVAGTQFVPSTVIYVNGVARTTGFISSTQVSVTLTTADLSASGGLLLTAVNPAPGGGTSSALSFAVTAPLAQPQILSVNPSQIYTGSADTTIGVSGSGFKANSVVNWNGTALTTIAIGYLYGYLTATVPAADLSTSGTGLVTVETPGASPSTSTALAVTVVDPPVPVLTSFSPMAGPIRTASSVTLAGTGFTSSSVVQVNGIPVATTYGSSTSLTATIPAASLSVPGNVNVTVMTPSPGGGTSSAKPFTVYLPIRANDIVYNSTDGLLYASIPPTTAGADGNSVKSIDPYTGNVVRQIWVGSDPNKLALSSDGTQLFVGLDGGASVAQVNLTQGKVVSKIALGGGSGLYNPPLTALYLAPVPGSPNSVVVATQAGMGNTGSGITIYDSGVARANAWTSGEGPMSFGSSASTLYVVSGATVERLTVDSTGVTAVVALGSASASVTWLQYDNGNLYLSSGQVLNASNGTLLGTFYKSDNTAATGPIVSDSTNGRAFVAPAYSNNSAIVNAFDESTFNLAGSITVNGVGQSGYGASFGKIVRWGQNGLAINAYPSAFTSQSQLFILQTPLVKDVSSSPADLSVTFDAPSAGTTGTSVSWVATIKNLGPNAATGAIVALTLDTSLVISSVSASTGTCGTGTSFSCSLGGLASGASATVTVNTIPTQAGSLEGTASIASTSYDPTSGNDQSTASTTVTGTIYGAVPAISGISPNLVQAGAADFILTVTGTGFNANSIIKLNSAQLATTYVSSTQLTATVIASQIANFGWAAITVSNPSPGGGESQIAPLTIYDLIDIPTSGLVYDPYSQWLYATIPSTATSITGNSVVQINPATGAVGTPVAVGSQPTVMAETTDGNYLYIGLSGSASLAKFDLNQQQVVNTISLSSVTNYYSTTAVATALAAMPGSDSTVAVDFSGVVGILDISGNTGAFRSSFAFDNFPAFADASNLYTYDNLSTGSEFYRFSIGTGGATYTDGTTLEGMGGFSGGFKLVNGLVYGFAGGIIDPSTTPPSQVATLPLIDFYGTGNDAYSAGAVADPSLSKEFMVLQNAAGSSAYGLARYDLSTYLPETILGLPSSISTFNSSLVLLRCGQDGVAVITSSSVGTSSVTPSILLIRGPFVVPQELGTGTAATLSASSSATITHGSGNTMLTLTGTNFLPGVAVTWNGSYRTTTIMNATHVTVAIPASDLASTGSASLVATNPAASASNALTITIN